MEIEAPRPLTHTLCPWRKLEGDEVEVCIKMKDHEGEHIWRPTGHTPENK